MALHQKAFWVMSFFLCGVLILSMFGASGHAILFAVLLSALVVCVFFGFGKFTMGFLSLAFIAGSFYAFYFNTVQSAKFTAPFGEKVEFLGVVERVSRGDESQSVDMSLSQPYRGKIRIYLREYPSVAYGDSIKITGSLQEIPADRRGYFLKENIGATMSFPKSIEIIAHGQGSGIKARLYAIRDSVEASFTRALAPKSATLMTGLTLGKAGGFSKEFTEKLKLTGTSHIVALSGTNITIIISAITFILSAFFSRKVTVYAGILAIIGFVVMTGAEASVVRAAIMATIVVIAERSSRIHSMKTAIVATAIVMILINPNILAFDIGFQLSFLALVGIVYLRPLLSQFFHASTKKGLLGWRENLWMTLSAQIAVLPILLANFGFFSPLSIITNMLILSFIPPTMFLGFLIFIASIFSGFLATVVALPAKIMLWYELGVIDIFSKFSFGITVQSFPIIFAVLYYGALIWFMIYMHKKYETPRVI